MSPRGNQRIFVAGHRGVVGSAIVRALNARGHAAPILRTRTELDLLDQAAVRRFFEAERPEVVFLAAAKVGGIHANNIERWSFIYENLVIETNVLGAALESGVGRLVFFGSSCVYPKLAPQPMVEEYLLTGPLEPTNEPYAIAKIAGLKLVESANLQHGRRWLSLMPTNLYGPNDNFDLEHSHVLPALIRKFHEAREERNSGGNPTVRLWGSGTVKREFLHADDAVAAALMLLAADAAGLYNVGSGRDQTVREIAGLVAGIVGYDGPVEWDSSRPDGTPRKLLDSSRIRSLGWRPAISLEDGIRAVYDWYRRASEAAMVRVEA